MVENNNSSSKRVHNEHALKKIPKTLIIGYGNPDREDDGVAWHILKGIARQFGLPYPETMEDELIKVSENLHFLFNLQLMPEMTYDMRDYSRICFVDAHTGALDNDLNWQILEGKFQNSPLTHHMTPQSVLSILETAFNQKPEAILVSVRGYQFGFEHELSNKTKSLAINAVEKISSWIVSINQFQ
jgi:hydrogenase maturation protease